MYKLYIGNETNISFKHAKALVKDLIVQTDITYISIDAERIESTKIIEQISSNSLFSSSRVLFIKRLYRNKDREHLIPFLIEYLDKNSKDNLIIWEDQKVSTATKYVKYFKEKKLLEEFNKLNKNSFKRYAIEKCQEHNLNLNTPLVDILCQYSNYDTERLENNIKKLKLLEKDTLTEDDISHVIANTLENDIWKLLEEINRDGGKPLDILQNILRQGTDPSYIIPMIARNLRLITLTKYLLSQNTPYSQIASIIKVPPFTIKPLVDSSNKYSWEKIRSKYQKLSNLDYEIKIGRIDSKLGLTLFCTTL